MSRLEDANISFRQKNVSRNSYDNNEQYNVGHSNALSNGDDKGKGENEGQVGSTTDIKTRERLVVKNKFNKNNEYNSATA